MVPTRQIYTLKNIFLIRKHIWHRVYSEYLYKKTVLLKYGFLRLIPDEDFYSLSILKHLFFQKNIPFFRPSNVKQSYPILYDICLKDHECCVAKDENSDGNNPKYQE